MPRPKGIKNNSGTKLSPRRHNGNIDWDQMYSQYIKPIIQNQIAPNTVRGIMYILVAKNILSKKDYGGLDPHLVAWRKDGRVAWQDISDGSGRAVVNDFSNYQSPSYFVNSHVDYLKYAGHYYREVLNNEWRWYGQDHYVEIFIEKQALTGAVAKYVGKRYVKVVFNKGNPGWGFGKECYDRLKEELRAETMSGRRRQVHILYLGDNDKYGNDMDRQIREQITFFGLSPNILERIALTDEQVLKYNIPTN
jgi:hypothetical protein